MKSRVPLRTINRYGLPCIKHRFILVQVDQSSLDGCSLIGDLAPLLCGFTFDVVLQGVSLFLLVSCHLLREGSSVWLRYGDLLRHDWYGLMHRGFLQQWCGHDGGGRGHHVASRWDRGARALTLTRC
jgi:hypothetical protein